MVVHRIHSHASSYIDFTARLPGQCSQSMSRSEEAPISAAAARRPRWLASILWRISPIMSVAKPNAERQLGDMAEA